LKQIKEELPMKKILAGAALALAMTAAGQADAFSLNGYRGPVEFKLAGVTESADSTYMAGETWGVFSLSAVTNGFTNIWAEQAGDHVYGIIYGLQDANAYANSASTFGYTIEQIGGHFALYATSQLIDFTTLSTTGRTGLNQFTGVTNGTLLFGGDFVPGILPTSQFNPTIVQDVTAAQAPANGKGSGYGDVDVDLGGTYASVFDSNSQDGKDLLFMFTVAEYNGSTVNGWDQKINDPVSGAAVPEPGTMVLLGFGMFGLAIFGKRRMDSKKA
jgi:hypothetical protein